MRLTLGEAEVTVKEFHKASRNSTPVKASSPPPPASLTPALPQAARLAGRVAVVTGAGGAIGAAIAERLAREGARVALADVDEAAVTQVAAGIVAAGLEAVSQRVDVTKEDAVAGWLDGVVQRWGRLDGACARTLSLPAVAHTRVQCW